MTHREDGLPTIGLAIIAKDEEETLPRLLESVGVRPVADLKEEPELAEPDNEWSGRYLTDAAVDFVVVCDTGSTDDTRKVARLYGCRVIDFEWVDDFGVARQASYDALPDVDFTLWADCDDVLEGAAQLRQLAARLPGNAAGTIHRYDYAQDEAGNCTCELWRERLVRHNIGAKWELPIHEILKVPAELAYVEEVIWHHRVPPKRERDPERNYKILKARANKARDENAVPDARTLAYLGTEAMALGRPEEAITCFEEYLSRPDAQWDEERCQVAHKLSVALRFPREEDDDDEKALRLDASAEAAFRAITERPDWADGYIDLAEIALDRRNWKAALRFCDTALRLDPPKTLLIINPLDYNYQPSLMRAVALSELGELEESMKALQTCLNQTPDRPDLLAQAGAIQGALATKKAEEYLLTLREILVRHDENEKAAKLMECAPYFTWDNPAVAGARLDQREMVLHSVDPEIYSSYYRDNPGESPFENTGVEIPEAHKTFHRVDLLRRGLDDQGDAEALRILDLSANDGWMLANLASGGYGTAGALHGLELNDGAAERANERPLLTDAGGKVIHDNLFNAAEHYDAGTYDAVVCFETIEHVPDPRALIEHMVSMCKPDGRIYVSTPEGAYERGNVPGWATVEQKGHLRAMRPQELAGLMCEIGVIENMEIDGHVQVVSAIPKERKGRVVFFTSPEALPEKILTTGLGGSETAMCKMAEHFARKGYDVRVFAGVGEGGPRSDRVTVEEPPDNNGTVLYAPYSAWDPDMEADLFVSSRVPEAFDRTIRAKRRVLWLHDAEYGDRLTKARIDRCTDILVLSEFQKGLLTDRYPDLALGSACLRVSRNGIETSWYEDLPGSRKPIVTYTSSPDRGLDVLFECWPEIKKRVPKAELHHAYAPYYKQMVAVDPALAAFDQRLQSLGKHKGIKDLGCLSQKEIAELFKVARVWAYPSWHTPGQAPFPEISCISGMEAQAGGTIPVCRDYGALKETVVCGERIDGGLDDDWRSAFIDAVVRALTDNEYGKAERKVGRKFALGLDWSAVADEWEETLMGEREAVAA